ncbi:cytochrome c [Methylocella tundrae]|uniref:c-type cytochrome n=1 Tax=Methylocella tundrae TaxID=227605 RepID=UPI002ADEBCA6|nr:cytochrome c [Methylocella tundrae]WPP02960.1 cytochrome c [Methylocella tundrae]
MERLTTAAARNIFYGGSIFFFIVFALLVGNSFIQARIMEQTNPISAEAAHGKRIWEQKACFDCHTLFGEGARFAPEIGKVWLKYGGAKDPAGAEEALKGWFAAQPTGVPGRHQMPQFHLSDSDMHDLIAFLRWTSAVDTQNWPPHAPK